MTSTEYTFKTLTEWQAFAALVQRSYQYRHAEAERQRIREEVAERTITAFLQQRRRLGHNGIVRQTDLTFEERRALYDLSDEQCDRLQIGTCAQCNEREFFDAGEMAEMYDPRNPEAGSKVLHADCTPEGWDTA